MNENIHANSYLTLHYRVTLNSGPASGKVFIDTFDTQPATLSMGIGQWLESMEQPLIGHTEGESLSYVVPASQAYGERNPELLQYVSRQMLQDNAEESAQYQPGESVEFTAPHGGLYTGIFRGWEGDKALFDFNHPLAGVDLKIDVKIMGVM